VADEEISAIAAGCGLIGVIFMNFWLDPADPGPGRASTWRTVEHIRRVTGSFDHVPPGTAFDGCTTPPDGIADASHLGAITTMRLERGVPGPDVLKILEENAQQVLEAG